MIKQGFGIGRRDWYIMCYYDIHTDDELDEVYGALLASGCPSDEAQRACMVLSQKNTGYTFTNFREHLSVMFIAEATSAEQMYDTIVHETKHVVEHIGEFYGVKSDSEESAYLQGEIARNMYEAVKIAVCPECGKLIRNNYKTERIWKRR